MENQSGNTHFGQECVVTCLSSQGVQIRANCARLNRHSLVFEVCGPGSTLLVSEVLGDFSITLRERKIFSGTAVVKQLVGTGLIELCEVELGEGWLDIEGFAALADKEQLRAEFQNYIENWWKQNTVRPKFKLHIADMQMFFMELRQWLDQVELGLHAAPKDRREDFEHDVIAQLAAAVIPYIDGLFEKFEMLADDIEQ